MEPKGCKKGHLKSRKRQLGGLRFLTHPTVNLLDFRDPGGVWRDTFSNCFSEVFVINASNAFDGDFIDFDRISGPSGGPPGSIFEESWEFFSR